MGSLVFGGGGGWGWGPLEVVDVVVLCGARDDHQGDSERGFTSSLHTVMRSSEVVALRLCFFLLVQGANEVSASNSGAQSCRSIEVSMVQHSNEAKSVFACGHLSCAGRSARFTLALRAARSGAPPLDPRVEGSLRAVGGKWGRGEGNERLTREK
eukprot:COSAG06_NODE_10796_length_1614_cov_3.229043_2_plen_155_part_00